MRGIMAEIELILEFVLGGRGRIGQKGVGDVRGGIL